VALMTIFAHKSYDNVLRKSEASFGESDPQRLMIESTSLFFTIVIVSARAVNVLPDWKGCLAPQLCQQGFGLLEVGLSAW
jgi:hypothetical protein